MTQEQVAKIEYEIESIIPRQYDMQPTKENAEYIYEMLYERIADDLDVKDYFDDEPASRFEEIISYIKSYGV